MRAAPNEVLDFGYTQELQNCDERRHYACNCANYLKLSQDHLKASIFLRDPNMCAQSNDTVGVAAPQPVARPLGVISDRDGAAAAFAGVILRFDTLPDGAHKRVIEQGYEMGRPSEIELSLSIEAGKLDAVRIGGYAVRVAEGMIEV